MYRNNFETAGVLPVSRNTTQQGIGINASTPTAPSYAAGGMIGTGGMPRPPMQQSAGVNPNAQAGAPMDPKMLDMQVNQFASQHPEQVAQIRNVVLQAMQTGELTQEELNTIVQLATVAAQNPEMYPHVRKFAIQQGIASEQDLSPQYDQGLIYVLLVVAKSIQQSAGGQNMMQAEGPAMAGSPATAPSMYNGGDVPQSKKASGEVLINAHEGEYVIPKRVVEMKGKEFFDSLLEKYKDQ